MAQDIVRDLGFLCLGSRFKRIGERLQADTARFIEASGVPLQPGQYPLLAAIAANGPLSVGELATTLGISQPGVTRNIARLVDMKLVELTRDPGDQRQKAVALTPAGRRMVEHSRREIWPHIEAAVVDLCAGLSGPLLKQLAAIEDGLADTPLDQRAVASTSRHKPKRVRATR